MMVNTDASLPSLTAGFTREQISLITQLGIGHVLLTVTNMYTESKIS